MTDHSMSPADPSPHDAAPHQGVAAPLDLVPLPGSERTAPPNLPAAGPRVRSDAPVEATVVLRRQRPLPSGVRLDRAQLAGEYGAAPADVDAVTSRLGGLGLQIESVDVGSRRIRVAGPADVVSRVFGTELAETGVALTSEPGTGGGVGGEHRVRTGGLSIPSDLAGIVTAVLGLDDRPQTRALYWIARPNAVKVSYTPVQLGTVYAFPPDTDGTGQTIAIIELGGGFVQSDLDTYFQGLGVASPSVTAVGVDGAENRPGADPNGADGEVMLDIEVAGALAPGAKFLVYFAPNTDAGFLDAVATAAHADPSPVAISISWGQAEDQWTEQARTAMDDAFADAAALGATVTVAAGDDGSTDRVDDGKVHVDFPAASPNALACGGTRLNANGETGSVSAEVVWNNGSGRGATGGGFSATFARPDYQSVLPAGGGAAGVAAGGGRGVPDVAAVADPQTGYEVLVDGSRVVIGGTSAVSPLWAALVARLAQAGGQPLGLLQPRLYAAAVGGAVPPGFRDVTSGDNGAYQAGPGWDACTGLGVPVGTELLSVFGSTHGNSN